MEVKRIGDIALKGFPMTVSVLEMVAMKDDPSEVQDVDKDIVDTAFSLALH